MPTVWEEYQEDLFLEYRERYLNIEANQAEELREELDELQAEFDRIVNSYTSGGHVDESIIGSKKFEIALIASVGAMVGIMAKHNQAVYRTGGDWAVEAVKPYEVPAYVQSIETTVSKLIQRTGERFLYRTFPADDKMIGSRITSIQGSTLRGVQNLLSVTIKEGRSAKEIAGILKTYVRKDEGAKFTSPFEWYRKRFGYKRAKPGNIRAGSLDYNMYRIARTEINYAWRDASARIHDGKDYLEGFDWVLSHSHPREDICFVDHNIKIFTSSGWKSIIDVEIGDLVMTHMGRFRKVTKLHRNKDKEVIVTYIKYNNQYEGTKKRKSRPTEAINVIRATSNHPFLVNGEWKMMGDIKIGDKVKILANRCINCNELIPYHRNVCSRSCGSKMTTRKQWSDQEHVKSVSKKRIDLIKKNNGKIPFLRFTGNEIRNNLEDCAKEIARVISNHSGKYEFMDVDIIDKWDVKIDKKLTKYNIEVEEDNSYLAKGFVVHNCDTWANESPYKSRNELPEGHPNCLCSVLPRLIDPRNM